MNARQLKQSDDSSKAALVKAASTGCTTFLLKFLKYSEPSKQQSVFAAENPDTELSEEDLYYAANIYYHVIRHYEDKGAAVLHKLRDPYAQDTLRQYLKRNPEAQSHGLLYTPLLMGGHTWDLNAAWVLGHVHVGRSFQLYSPLTDNYLKRPNSKRYSALAKEVACIHLSGYKVTMVNYEGFVIFESQNREKAKSMRLKDFLMGDDKVANHIASVQQELAEVEEKQQSVKQKIVTLAQDKKPKQFINPILAISPENVDPNFNETSFSNMTFFSKNSQIPIKSYAQYSKLLDLDSYQEVENLTIDIYTQPT